MQKITPKSCYMMRHGQTTDNVKKLISGSRSDPDLTDDGRAQAVKAGEVYRLLNDAPDRIIITGLKRTHQTAQSMSGLSDFITDTRLNERDLGEDDGKITEAEQKEKKDRKETSPGEESYESQSLRVIEGVNAQLEVEGGVSLYSLHTLEPRGAFWNPWDLREG